MVEGGRNGLRLGEELAECGGLASVATTTPAF
jgi:hypothetical protein